MPSNTDQLDAMTHGNQEHAPDMTAKVCLITGANRGIGKATSLGLANMNATVIMVCRDEQLGQAARAEIIAETGNQAVELLVSDLSSQKSIHQLGDAFKDRYRQLHVLVNNAGLSKRHRTVTEDSLETTFAVNHLAPFLLTNLLLDCLKAGAPARIVTVASMVHRWGRIDFENLQGNRSYSMDRAYNQSKLANVLFTYELARRLKGSGITVNCVHPGLVATGLAREYTGFKGLMANRLWRPFMKSPRKGAETVIYLASSPDVESVTAKYFANSLAVRSSHASNNEALARRLWEVSERLIEKP